MPRKKTDYDELYSRYLLLPKSISMTDAVKSLGVCYQTLRNCLDNFGVFHKTRREGRHRVHEPNTPFPPRLSVSKIESKVKSSPYQSLMREVADSIRDRLRNQ